jgi:hypothetical protein
MPVTRPALQRKLLHRAAARLAPMTKGARTAARMRKRPRFRRSQAWVNSPYFLAAPSPPSWTPAAAPCQPACRQ